MDERENCVLVHDFDPGFSWFAKVVKLESFPELEEETRELYDLAVKHLHPKSIHRVEYIDQRGKGTENSYWAHLGSVKIEGSILNKLDPVSRVFPYITTCGNELESIDLSRFDALSLYWLSILKTKALALARREMKNHIKETYRTNRLNSLNPGSGDLELWPIEELRKVFSLFKGGHESIGVRLSESCLMIPDKCLAGLLFESDHSYESCAYCKRENCPDRRVENVS